MKKISIGLMFIFFSYSLVYGSGGPAPPPPFLNTEVSGLPYQAPLFFADSNTVTFLAQMSFYSPSTVDGNIEVEGTTEALINNESSKNLKWNIPSSSLNVGMSVNTGKSWAIFILMRGENGKNGFTANADLGASLLLSSVNDVRARMDFGFSSLSMDMKTVFLQTGYNDSSYTTRTTNNKSWDPFVSLTVNTAINDWIINPYLQVSYCYQTLFNIEWSSDVEVYSNIHVVTLTSGFIYRINKNILLVAGGSYFVPQIKEKSSGIFSGFVQANFMF